MKFFNKIYGIATFAIITFLSCSDEEGNTIIDTVSPSEFSISLSNIQLYSADLEWSSSVDPQGGNVTYDVYMNDGQTNVYTEIVKGMTERKYSLTDLNYNQDYFVYIDANDPDGNRYRQTLAFKTTNNLSPTDFVITVDEVVYNTAKINWTEATDPEGTAVTYDVYVNDALIAENLTMLTYDVTDLNYVSDNIVRIVAKDTLGFSTSMEVTVTTCSPDLSGVYSVLSSGTSTDSGPVNNPLVDLAYVVTITSNNDGTYSMSDGMAGVYIEWYSIYGYSFETPGLFTDDCGSLTGEWNTGFTSCCGDLLTFSGTVNLDGTMNISWANAFGDQATAVYTKQ